MRFEELKNTLKDLVLIGKGWRSYVYRANYNGIDLAIKVAKDKSVESAIRKEGDILELLKGIKHFPQIVLRGEDFIAYHFIDGVPFEKYPLTKEEKTKIYLQVLELAYVLDSMGISKDEFQRLDRNLLIDKDGEVYLIDFERGKYPSKRKTNLPQFLQLLVREGYITIERAIELGRSYAQKPEEVFHEVKRVISGSP